MSSTGSGSGPGGARVLEGVRVVELGVIFQAPLAAAMLGALGADVVKVEAPDGDRARLYERYHGAPVKTDNGSIVFQVVNRNKRSISLDLDTPEGKDVLRRLLAGADVFISNLREETLETFGAAYEQVTGFNPRIVYALASGLGAEGPWGGLPIQDTIALGHSGFALNSSQTPDLPANNPGSIADVISGTNLGTAVLAGLLERARTGGPVRVTGSLLQSLIWTQMFGMTVLTMTGERLELWDRETAANPLLNFYLCQDGLWVILGVTDARHWERVCIALDVPELVADERFTDHAGRYAHRRELCEALSAVFARRPRDAWVRTLVDHRIRCGIVNQPEEVLRDPQALLNGYLRPDRGSGAVTPLPFDMDGLVPPDVPPPHLGGDGVSVLSDWLAMLPSEIDGLREAGALKHA